MADKLLYRSEDLILSDDPGRAELHWMELRRVDGQLVAAEGRRAVEPVNRDGEPATASDEENCYFTQQTFMNCVNGLEKVTTCTTFFCNGQQTGYREDVQWGGPCG